MPLRPGRQVHILLGHFSCYIAVTSHDTFLKAAIQQFTRTARSRLAPQTRRRCGAASDHARLSTPHTPRAYDAPPEAGRENTIRPSVRLGEATMMSARPCSSYRRAAQKHQPRHSRRFLATITSSPLAGAKSHKPHYYTTPQLYAAPRTLLHLLQTPRCTLRKAEAVHEKLHHDGGVPQLNILLERAIKDFRRHPLARRFDDILYT